jgi:hypothetical protein
MMAYKPITPLQGEDTEFEAENIYQPGVIVGWMQYCFGHHFMVVLQKQETLDGYQQFFALVQLIGSREQAENFACKLALNGQRSRLTEATPSSIREGVSSVITNSLLYLTPVLPNCMRIMAT